jgi:hypothetical protein
MIEKKEAPNWLDDFAKESTPDASKFGYVPLPTTVQGEPEGSVYAAHLRQENTIGSMLNRKSTAQLSEDVREDYDFTNYANKIPRDLVSYADKFFGATTDDEFKSIESQIRQEIGDKSVLAAHPWKALAYAFDPLEPTNWLPGGVIYKEAKVGAAVARSMMGGAISAVASTGIQEAVLHQNQLTRSMQESIFNTVGAGVVGGVIGGGISALGSRGIASKTAGAINPQEVAMMNRIQTDVNDALTPNDSLSAAKSAIMDDNEIARMPKFIANTMKLTPMNRLLTSPFKTAKWFGSSAYEHNYELVKNSSGIATPTSLEQSIKTEMRALGDKQIDHMNYFYEMHGVTSKTFKATRKKMAELGSNTSLNINLDQFNKAVYETALTGTEHELPQINSAAKMWRDEFDGIKDQAVKLGLLPEGVTVPNAANYIMVMYNKNKIIEQGGKSARGEGTFPEHLFQQFKASNETTKRYLSSPTVEAHLKNIEDANIELKLHSETIKNDINPKVMQLSKNLKKLESEKQKSHPASHLDLDAKIKKLQGEIDALREKSFKTKALKKPLEKTIEDLNKLILEGAPDGAKDWEGKLHRVIEDNGVEDEEVLLWNQVEQTIDHILGDSDGKLLNPFLSKLGGSTRPFKARKLIIDQLAASPWHITDIQKIAEAHSRAMVPAIKLQEFAQSQGFKDIDDFLLGMGDLIRKEFDAKSKGLTGKKAQKLREQYDSAIKDMQATVQMLQGVYGQGFNVLNSKSAEFFSNVLNWNYSRMLGHMTVASLPDLGLVVMRNGLMDTLAQGIGESFSVVKKISKNDIRALGYAIETEQGSQFKSYIEHHGLSTNPSPFTKGLNSLTRHFGNLSLMNPWQDMIQNLSGHMAINKILHIVHKSVDGKSVSKKETALVARLGVGNEHYADIAKFTKDNVHKGTRYADWTNWDIKSIPEANALKAFQGAVAKSIDEIAIVPNLGDKPLLLQQKGAFGNMSRLMFQFKSYLLAATNRILYAGIQNKGDINMYLGVVSMMGMGMLGYTASSWFRGSKDEIDLSPKNILREGLDRSGVLGIFGEGINIGQKLFQLGEVSRYKSRDAFGSVLGPTGGSASQLVSLFNKLNPLSSAKGEWTTKDAEAVMRLMPLQNLFYLQKINRQLAHNIAEGLGATPVND